MRVGGEAPAFGQFLAEIGQVAFIEPAFEERPRVNARRGVALEIDHVAGKILGARTEKMVEGDLIKRSREA